MKRLIKASNNIVSEFLQSHVLYNITNNNIVEEILNLHNDCSYNGTLYRALVFEKEDFNDYNDIEEIRKYIRITNKFRSCTNDLNSAREFANSIIDDYIEPLIVIIQFEGTGLDINLLVSKSYENNFISEDIYRELMPYLSYNEILAIVPPNFEILDF